MAAPWYGREWFGDMLRRAGFLQPSRPGQGIVQESRPLKRKWDGRAVPELPVQRLEPAASAAGVAVSRAQRDGDANEIMRQLGASIERIDIRAHAAETRADAEAKEQREWDQKVGEETLRREAERTLHHNDAERIAAHRARERELAARRAGNRHRKLALPSDRSTPFAREMAAAARALAARREDLRLSERRLEEERAAVVAGEHAARERRRKPRRGAQERATSAAAAAVAAPLRPAPPRRALPPAAGARAVAAAVAAAAAHVPRTGLLPHEQSSWRDRVERSARANLRDRCVAATANAERAAAAALVDAAAAEQAADEVSFFKTVLFHVA